MHTTHTNEAATTFAAYISFAAATIATIVALNNGLSNLLAFAYGAVVFATGMITLALVAFPWVEWGKNKVAATALTSFYALALMVVPSALVVVMG